MHPLRFGLYAVLLGIGLLLPNKIFALSLPAPEFPEGTAWINAKPLTLEMLRARRVTLAVFFHSANLNSLRTLAILNAWHEHYEFSGLLIIGIHTPEYEFQKDALKLREFIKKHRIQFPIAIDNDHALWKAYENEGWPAFYLIDPKGNIVFEILGEGRFLEIEREIRKHLERAKFDLSAVPKKLEDQPETNCGLATPEITTSAKNEKLAPLKVSKRPREILISSREGEAKYFGKWTLEPDSLRLAQKNKKLQAFLRVIYRAAQSFALLAPAPQGASRFYIKQDNMWLHTGNAGKDIDYDDEGRSFVTVSETRLYQLTQNPMDTIHEMMIIPQQQGSVIFGVSFPDRCRDIDLSSP